MRVVMKQEVNRVKNGFAARCSELRVVAHGYSPETATQNLERLVLLYLRPFERQGTLSSEIKSAGLRAEDEGSELTVVASKWP